MTKYCTLVGAPVQSGASQPGCLMGPDAYRTAGLAETLRDLGHRVLDQGNLKPVWSQNTTHENAAIHDLSETVAWAMALEETSFNAMLDKTFPIFLGGDHSLAIGSVSGVTRAAQAIGRPQFVLWLDAHPDFHTLGSTKSGNLHGTPMAYCTGQPGFDGVYPDLHTPVPTENVCMMGLRSVDPHERESLFQTNVRMFDMRSLDESGVINPLARFLNEVGEANGALHVSLDVDFLDPSFAPAVGTTVPGGATFREAHLIMEMLCDSDLVTSLDLVELNPFLDERGKTAKLMVDLCASLMGRKVFDRKTASY